MCKKIRLHSKYWFTSKVGKIIIREIFKIEQSPFDKMVTFFKVEVQSRKKALWLYQDQNKNFTKYQSYE